MKILYLHQYFKTPAEGGAIRSWHIAKGMVQAGHEVVVITSRNNITSSFLQCLDGITIHYLPVTYDNSFGFFRRSVAFLSFMIQAFLKAKKERQINLCYATSTPITVGVISYLLKRKRGIPYIFEVRDLWPEAPIQMGVIKNTFIKNILFKIEKIIYAQADKIIALSPGMKEGVLRVSPEKRVVVVPNMSDCDFFQFEQKKPALESQFGVVGKFVVSYIGSAGPANHLMHLVQLINFCNEKNINNIFFLIQAAGSELNYIQSSIQKNASVKFVEYGNKECVKEVLNISDAVYISFATKPILQTNSPNKFFDALAAGRLSIVNTEGWLKDLIEHEAIGFYVDPFKPETFVEKIQPYLNDKTRLHASQSNARRVAENQYSVNILVKKIIAELE